MTFRNGGWNEKKKDSQDGGGSRINRYIADDIAVSFLLYGRPVGSSMGQDRQRIDSHRIYLEKL